MGSNSVSCLIEVDRDIPQTGLQMPRALIVFLCRPQVIKYALIVLHADDNGQGASTPLLLVLRHAPLCGSSRWVLTALQAL